MFNEVKKYVSYFMCHLLAGSALTPTGGVVNVATLLAQI
jgi:hypothetical protein